MTLLWRWVRRAVFATVLAFLTLIVGGAYDARWRLPTSSRGIASASTMSMRRRLDERFTFAQYLAREEQLFAQVRAFESTIDPADRTPVNRYHRGQPVASVERRPATGTDPSRPSRRSIRGGALLIHGLTDSPYSMRAIADVLRKHGVYSLALRMPGHGTVPSGLVQATWHDWLAAVRMGVRHVRSRTPAGAPLISWAIRTAARWREVHAEAIEGGGGPRAVEARAAVADDWRDARGPARVVGQPAWRRAVLREGELAGRPAGIQPVQVQLVPGQRRRFRPRR